MTLHLLALAPAALGLCCLAADRRRARALELAAAVLMLLAMADAAMTGVVPVVWWAAALLVGAMVLAAARGRGRGRVVAAGGAADMPGTAMTVHSATGMVVMAALMVAMAGHSAAATNAHAQVHLHGGTVPSLAVAGFVLAAAHLVASVVLAARSRAALSRAQYAAMAGSVAVMSLALIA